MDREKHGDSGGYTVIPEIRGEWFPLGKTPQPLPREIIPCLTGLTYVEVTNHFIRDVIYCEFSLY